MKPKEINGVPIQHKGASQDNESYRKIVNAEETEQKFTILKERFFYVNSWKEYCGEGSADFQLFDHQGNKINRKPIKGDHIRIDIPGPGDLEAQGYDWVEIVDCSERVCEQEELESYIMTCRPCRKPESKNTHVAHFYAQESTSTIIISRGKDFLKAGVYLRNEVSNKDTGFFNRIRNFFISIAGDIRFTKVQWKNLSEGLLDFN